MSSSPAECILVLYIRWDFFLCTNWLAESARAWGSNTRWKIDEQWDCRTLCAIKIEGKNRGGEGTTPVWPRLVQKLERKSVRKKKKKNEGWTTPSAGTLVRTSVIHSSTAVLDSYLRTEFQSYAIRGHPPSLYEVTPERLPTYAPLEKKTTFLWGVLYATIPKDCWWCFSSWYYCAKIIWSMGGGRTASHRSPSHVTLGRIGHSDLSPTLHIFHRPFT